MTVIIAVHNEEKRIREKIENTLQQRYPRERLEIMVASDCSTDLTDQIVGKFEPYGVRLVCAQERRGKEAAQKLAVDHSSGEVLVFSDAATMLPPDAIRNIVMNFSDPTVGCVSGIDQFIDLDGKLSGEGAYVKYEMWLRKLETKVYTLVGLSGSFFAARREVCRNWAVDLQSDFHTVLNAVKMGLRGVLDPDSVGFYKNLADEKEEFERKVRTVLRGISVVMKGLPMLNPFRYGLFSWQLFSHKLCRWLVPYAMILAFVSNGLLATRSTVYAASFFLQGVLYMLAFLGKYRAPSKQRFLKIPTYVVATNLAILRAWVRYLTGERVVSWESSKR